MKNSIKALAALAVLGFSGTAFATGGPTNTATSNASATVVMPIKLTETGSLSFGNIVGSVSGGTVVDNGTYGTNTYSNGTNPGSAGNAGTVSVPSWQATGQPSWTFQITGSSGTFTVTDGNNDNMTVTLPVLPGGTGSTSTASVGLALDNTGQYSWTTNGASLAVGANQPTQYGAYVGSFSYTVNYD
jgi:hypothetical protein